MVTGMSGFHKRECSCNHTAKHHKVSGHCRPGCDCTAAARKANRKNS